MPTGQVINETELAEVRKAFDHLMQSMKSKINDEDPANLERRTQWPLKPTNTSAERQVNPIFFTP